MTEPIIERACAKLRSAIAADEAVMLMNFAGGLREMVDVLEVLQPVLEEAQMRALRDERASFWLQSVRVAAYSVMDMVDELQDMRSQAAETMTRMLPKAAIRKNAIKMKENTELVMSLQEEWHTISQPQERLYGRTTGPYLEEASIVGRGGDKHRIMAVLLSAASNITQGLLSCIILPIYGFAGSGKTTLAQMVFKDTGSLKNYNFRVWVHVSPEFIFHGIVEDIFCQVSEGEQKEGGMAHIMKCLRELLNGMKVLLVLDDLWEEDPIQLQLLKSMLTFLGAKVDVIVTTCNHAIARKICTVEPYRLNALDDDACWEIIKKSIYFEEHHDLENIGQEMARKCHGLPSVPQVFAGIRRKFSTVEPYRLNPLGDDTCLETVEKFSVFQEEMEKMGRKIARKCWGIPIVALEYARMLVGSPGPAEWEEIMERNVWDNHYSSPNLRSILQTLFLSYRSMPPELRLCFDYYCDIFPNSHSIVKDDLVHQWIALNLIEPSERLSATDIAEGHITMLLDMSFLQTAKSDHASANEDKGATLFTMHNLAHDFASLMSKKFGTPCLHYMVVTNCCGKLDDRYGSDLRVLRSVGCSKVEFNDDSFSRKKYLRVLELKESSVQKLPDSISQLRHLGYLKITEFSGLVTLPESFGDLKNMLHIDLSGCSGLGNLPDSFGKLILLMHLNLSGCSGVVTLPESFGKLISLVHVNLSGCSGLVTLPESFGNLISLVHVNLSGCSGLITLPGSFGKLIRLVQVNLSGCSRLATLPGSFGKLISLVHVNLSGCSGLATLPESFGDLMNLTHVNLSRCHQLSEILEILQKLVKLAYLDLSFWSCFEGIEKCLSLLTNLEHLNLSHPCCHLSEQRSNLQQLKDGVCKLTSLLYLNLSMCLNPIFYYKSEEDSLQYIESCISGLSSLEHLDLSHNIFLLNLPRNLGDLNRLHTLDLSGCIRLKRIGTMKSIKFIALRNCRGLESCHFVVRADDDGPYSSSNIVQLEDVNCQELQICCLENVMSLEEAQRIRLVEKQKVERLKLCWTIRDTLGFLKVEENDLLGQLVPPHSLQCLELQGYSGKTCLPAWRIPSISSHFPNLMEVTMEDFPRCMTLPPLGLLPNLKLLVLRRMPNITRIDDIDSNRAAFSRLTKVTIDDMKNLKVFLFPGVAQLVIQKCPELSFGPLPPKARKLVISGCNKVMSSWGKRQTDGEEGHSSSTPVSELVVENCDLPPGDSSLLHHLPGLRSLTFKKCSDIITSSKETTQAPSSLESLPECLGGITSLRELIIQSCIGMKSLIQNMTKLPNLKDLYILDCPELKRWCESEENKAKLAHIRPKYECQEYGLTTFIRKGIFSPKNLVQASAGDHELKSMTHSTCLVSGDGEEGPSSSTPVSELAVDNCNLPLGVSSLLHHLPGLCSLTFKNCDDLITSSAEIIQAPSSLQSLCFSHCEEMISLPEYLDDLSSLQELTIQSCHRIEFSLQSMSKLTKLKDLYILDCPELKRWCESKENELKLAHIRPKYE
ncbi:hypothetical protein QYE76_038120 [Lolium multiflorum]|uniref:Uncharacterized protein n=1 Tax=Lolium multiflorum TaxID=4521 RepID=A0AAD8T8G7_LOLMU|nr:hypothetical protein QYE76_038120 [Lolium multiflorum]